VPLPTSQPTPLWVGIVINAEVSSFLSGYSSVHDFDNDQQLLFRTALVDSLSLLDDISQVNVTSVTASARRRLSSTSLQVSYAMTVSSEGTVDVSSLVTQLKSQLTSAFDESSGTSAFASALSTSAASLGITNYVVVDAAATSAAVESMSVTVLLVSTAQPSAAPVAIAGDAFPTEAPTSASGSDGNSSSHFNSAFLAFAGVPVLMVLMMAGVVAVRRSRAAKKIAPEEINVPSPTKKHSPSTKVVPLDENASLPSPSTSSLSPQGRGVLSETKEDIVDDPITVLLKSDDESVTSPDTVVSMAELEAQVNRKSGVKDMGSAITEEKKKKTSKKSKAAASDSETISATTTTTTTALAPLKLPPGHALTSPQTREALRILRPVDSVKRSGNEDGWEIEETASETNPGGTEVLARRAWDSVARYMRDRRLAPREAFAEMDTTSSGRVAEVRKLHNSLSLFPISASILVSQSNLNTIQHRAPSRTGSSQKWASTRALASFTSCGRLSYAPRSAGRASWTKRPSSGRCSRQTLSRAPPKSFGRSKSRRVRRME